MSDGIKKIKIYLFVIFIFSFLFMDIGYSEEVLEDDSNVVTCILSDEYERLSDEEKKKLGMPVCEIVGINTKSSLFTANGVLPSLYDIRNESYVSVVKNQQQTGSCWAHAATTALEIYERKFLNLEYVFSPRHIEYMSTRTFLNGQINDYGYNRTLGSGGNINFSSNYFINKYGPISEDEMPFENNEDLIDINDIQNKNILLDVNNVILHTNSEHEGGCTVSEIEEIKKYVLDKGAAVVSVNMNGDYKYYNFETNSLYYNGTDDITHQVTIVGWNDNFASTKFNFENRPSSNGAWIVQNSWGEDWGEKGYFYVSYEDVHICDSYMVIDNVDAEMEDNIYFHDKISYNAFLGNGSSNSAYAMNIFTKTEGKEEILKEVTFGTPSDTGNYKIYYKKGNASSNLISDMTEIGSGIIKDGGYITHELDSELLIEKEVTDFSVVVYYDMDNTTSVIPISTKTSSGAHQYVTSEVGKGYYSFDGKSWRDFVSSYSVSIASIKVSTDDVDYEFSIDSASITKSEDNVLFKLNTTTRNVDIEDVEVIIKDSNNEVIIAKNISYKIENNKLKVININLLNSLKTGVYTAYVYYQDKYIGKISKEIVNSNIITSSLYTIDQDELLIYVLPQTTVEGFRSNISDLDADLYKGVTLVESGYVASGFTTSNYSIVVKGDVTGDGNVKMNDVMKISKYLVESTGITEKAYLKASDVTGDTNIKMNDVMRISKYIVEGGTL